MMEVQSSPATPVVIVSKNGQVDVVDEEEKEEKTAAPATNSRCWTTRILPPEERRQHASEDDAMDDGNEQQPQQQQEQQRVDDRSSLELFQHFILRAAEEAKAVESGHPSAVTSVIASGRTTQIVKKEEEQEEGGGDRSSSGAAADAAAAATCFLRAETKGIIRSGRCRDEIVPPPFDPGVRRHADEPDEVSWIRPRVIGFSSITAAAQAGGAGGGRTTGKNGKPSRGGSEVLATTMWVKHGPMERECVATATSYPTPKVEVVGEYDDDGSSSSWLVQIKWHDGKDKEWVDCAKCLPMDTYSDRSSRTTRRRLRSIARETVEPLAKVEQPISSGTKREGQTSSRRQCQPSSGSMEEEEGRELLDEEATDGHCCDENDDDGDGDRSQWEKRTSSKKQKRCDDARTHRRRLVDRKEEASPRSKGGTSLHQSHRLPPPVMLDNGEQRRERIRCPLELEMIPQQRHNTAQLMAPDDGNHRERESSVLTTKNALIISSSSSQKGRNESAVVAEDDDWRSREIDALRAENRRLQAENHDLDSQARDLEAENESLRRRSQQCESRRSRSSSRRVWRRGEWGESNGAAAAGDERQQHKHPPMQLSPKITKYRHCDGRRGDIGRRRDLFLSFQVVGPCDERQCDRMGVGLIARRNIAAGEMFFDRTVTYCRGGPPKGLDPWRYLLVASSGTGAKKGLGVGNGSGGSCRGYFRLTNSWTEWMNEPNPRKEQVANVKWTVPASEYREEKHLPARKVLAWRVIRDISEGEEVLAEYRAFG